jgi:hypothetical protein
MLVSEAQREVRLTFLGGFPGQAVSGILWLLSAALGSAGRIRFAMLVLAVGGMFIFPLTMLLLRATGRRASLGAANPLGGLAMQIAFTIPLSLPLVGAATLHRQDWFYPAFMVVVGAHYLPFVFLYGMWSFAVLAALLIGCGVWIGLTMPAGFSTGAWVTGALLLAFAFVGLMIARREERQAGLAPR